MMKDKKSNIEKISPLVHRVTAGNSSVFTGPGTNTYLIGDKDVTVLDPGPALQEHIDSIASFSSNINQIVITHTHLDHSPGVKLLKDKLDIPAYGLITDSSKDQDRTLVLDEQLEHGQILSFSDYDLEVVHTPGHASNHLCYILKQEELIFTGDHIMNGSTVVIAPPDGNMKHYLESLEILKDYKLKTIAPGHGDLLENPYAVADWIIQHRLEREKKVKEALDEVGKGSPDSLVEKVYDDVSEALFPIAKWSLESHLIKLYEEDRIKKEGKTYFSKN